VKLAVPLAIPGHGTLELNGKIDRLDRLADGTVRIIDYKLGSVARLSDLVKAGSEGQLLAYAAGVEARGEHLAEAYYRGLGDQRRVVCLEAKRKGEAIDVGKVIAQRLENLSKAIVRLASGDAQASVDGATFQRGYAPIARLDEARLDLGRGDEEDGP
jgi:RecB family exonuclease